MVAVGGGYLNKWPPVAQGEENVYIMLCRMLPDATPPCCRMLPDTCPARQRTHAQCFCRILALGLHSLLGLNSTWLEV